MAFDRAVTREDARAQLKLIAAVKMGMSGQSAAVDDAIKKLERAAHG